MHLVQEKQLAEQIEALIDAYGLSAFLSVTGYVCGEKSEHVATQWQDTTLAKAWLKASVEIDNLVAKVEASNL